MTQAPAQGNVGAGSGALIAGARHEGGQGNSQGLFDNRRSLSDGDTLFALSTGLAATSPGMTVLCVMAAEAVALATVQAVKAAQSWGGGGLRLPAANDRDAT